MCKIGLLYPKGGLLKEEIYHIYAQEANKLGAEIICFSKESVDWATKTIKGYVFKSGRWRKKESPFPRKLIVKDPELVNDIKLWTELMIVPFPEEGLLGKNKWVIYEKLQKGPFQDDMVPCTKIKSSGHFFRILKEYRKLVIKPTVGVTQYVVEQKGIRYYVMSQGEIFEQSQTELRTFIIDLQKREQHVIQPHLLCRTNNGEIFNLEVTLQKNKQNHWGIKTIAPRFYMRKNQYLNEQDIDFFVSQNVPGSSSQTLRNLKNFIFNFIQRLDDVYKSVGELSLSIKLDDLQKFWLDEIHWKVDQVDFVRNQLKNMLFMTEKGELE